MISHHPPVQYDRTILIAGLRLCARCTGLLGGLLLGVMVLMAAPGGDFLTMPVLLGLVMVVLVLGVIAFVQNEIGLRQSNNAERIAFGLSLGFLWAISWEKGVYAFLVVVAFIVCGQFASAHLLRKYGHLDRFVSEYIDGAIVKQPTESYCCEQLLCTCTPKKAEFDK